MEKRDTSKNGPLLSDGMGYKFVKQLKPTDPKEDILFDNTLKSEPGDVPNNE